MTSGRRPTSSVRLDGQPVAFQVTPFMKRHLTDLAQEYGNESAIIKAALSTWRQTLKIDSDKSDLQALRTHTGLRSSEVIEYAVYDLWRRWKGL